jgi:hypothetical protein
LRAMLAAMTIPARPRLTGEELLKLSQAILHRFEQMFEADEPPLANREGRRRSPHWSLMASIGGRRHARRNRIYDVAILADLALGHGPLLLSAKAAILFASAIGGVAGWFWLGHICRDDGT